MIAYLDTHVAVFVYKGDKELFSTASVHILETAELRVSPMAVLEMDYLFEVGKITVKGRGIADYLSRRFGISIDMKSLSSSVLLASGFSWTRDPFDRIITAQAAENDAILLTRDRTIHANYEHAIW